MPLILRVDVDKPYGHHTFLKRLISKLGEELYFPKIKFLGYLHNAKLLLDFCNEHEIPALWYFRNCTLPKPSMISALEAAGHTIGFHAENTRTIKTFKSELRYFEKKSRLEIRHFTKHGSGKLTLGRHHFAPYEPDKYLDWAERLNINFSFGNGIATSFEDLKPVDNFYQSMFWLELNYRSDSFHRIEGVIEFAKDNVVVLVIHPSNFLTDMRVKSELLRIVKLAEKNSIVWLKDIREDD